MAHKSGKSSGVVQGLHRCSSPLWPLRYAKRECPQHYGSGSVWIILIIGFLTVGCVTDKNCNDRQGTLRLYPQWPSEILSPLFCRWGNKPPLSSYASTPLVFLRNPRIVHGIVSIIQPLLDQQQALSASRSWRDAGKLSKLPIGLLPVVAGNITTAVVFVVLRGRCAPKKGRQRPVLFDYRTSQSLLAALLAGLAATILLSFLEGSLRILYRSEITSSRLQTWSETPASIAGVTRNV